MKEYEDIVIVVFDLGFVQTLLTRMEGQLTWTLAWQASICA